MVNDPTRIESGNILDLILNSNPSIITNSHTTPGMSDHEAVTFEVTSTQFETGNHLTKYLNTNQQTGANSWTKYLNWQTDILVRTQTHKTSKQTGPFSWNPNYTDEQHHPELQHQGKIPPPWILHELIRMQRRINKSHKKAKQTGLNKHWEQFREAFDKVTGKGILSKLTSHGITGNTHNWITSFLSNHTQRVSVNWAISDITMLYLVSHRAQFWDVYSSCCTSTT